MNNINKALLLVGSPKGERSTSLSLGNYLVSKLEEFGMASEVEFIHRLVNREEAIQNLYSMINGADLIILSFPLYVDSLPAPVIKAMELIKAERDKLESDKHNTNLIAICNSGFIESSQSAVALQICRNFANSCGFIWKGGVAMGGGGAIDGDPLQKKEGMLRNVLRGFDIAAQALKDDKEIPQEAIKLISKKLMPRVLYNLIGNLSWRLEARKFAKRKIRSKPYSL